MGETKIRTCDRCGRTIISADMEAVSDWIHVHIDYHGPVNGMPEDFSLCSSCKAQLMRFIRNIDPTIYLKEPIILNKGSYKDDPVYLCPVCRKNVEPEQKFCSECGLPLDWKRYDDDLRNERNEYDDSV